MVRLLNIAGLAVGWLVAGLVPALVANAGAAGIAVYVAHPVFETRRGDAVIRRRDAIREAIAAAFDASCRPAVTFDAGLDELVDKVRARLAGGDGSGLSGVRASEKPAPRGLIAASISRRGRKYQIKLAAYNLKTGKLYGTGKARSRLLGIEAAAAKAAQALRASMPCPRWLGEIIVSSQTVNARKTQGASRKGRIEWTLLIEISKNRINLAGGYAIEIDSARCAQLKPKGECVSRRISGKGVVRPGPGNGPGKGNGPKISVTGDGRYSISVGDAVARTRLRSVYCTGGKGRRTCRTQTLVSDQFLAGASVRGRQPVSGGTLVGAAIIAQTKELKKTMSWSLQAEFD